MNKKDEIVKVRKSELTALLESNAKAYNLLDNITSYISEVEESVRSALSALEDAPNEIEEFDEDEDEDEDPPVSKDK